MKKSAQTVLASLFAAAVMLFSAGCPNDVYPNDTVSMHTHNFDTNSVNLSVELPPGNLLMCLIFLDSRSVVCKVCHLMHENSVREIVNVKLLQF